MASALRSLLLASFVCGFTALLAPGCSRQGEGERCDRVKAQDSDCDSGLVCVPLSQLRDKATDRCCPPTPGDESDDRCRRGTATVPGPGPGTGEGGTPGSGEPTGGGESAGGAAGAATSDPDAGGNGGASTEPASGGQPAAGAPTIDAGGASGASAGAGA